ncbi:MAG: pyridoxamine 5'-phosphate oxidase [Bdellovibrionales bacterium]|nr:pyridoxamine 5'-phosphate oxidase [Bdellovibrionales bacterium]
MDNLSNYSLNTNPMVSFLDWYEAAKNVEQNPEAMTLSTVDGQLKRPDSRTVLFKGAKESSGESCLTFYTNYLSNKGRELEVNNEATILFYWHVSKRQVRIHGKVEKMSPEDSKNYFHSRDRQSQLASFISDQSSEIADKDSLLRKLEEATKKYAGGEIPYPSNWGGYLFRPYEFEFFVYGDYRINDRFLFKKNKSDWTVTRLQP